MDKMNYFRFGDEHTFLSEKVSGGLLSFLPEEGHYVSTSGLKYIYWELEHMVLLEIRGTVSEVRQRLDLLHGDIGLWQVYQFINQVEIFLPFGIQLMDNRGMSIVSRKEHTPLLMDEGRQWLFCIGYKQTAIPLLLQEFGDKLPDLSRFFETEDELYYKDVDFSIGHRFRELFDALEKIEYRAFSFGAEISMLLSKLFELYCQQLQPNGQSYTSLYHKTLDYIRANADKRLNKKQIAEELCVSPSTLDRAFKDKPYKIGEYIQRMRLNKPKEMLFTEDKTVYRVAKDLHFPNRRYFEKTFKDYFVQTPASVQELGALYYIPLEEKEKGE